MLCQYLWIVIFTLCKYNNATRKSVLNFRLFSIFFADLIPKIVRYIPIKTKEFTISYYKPKDERKDSLYFLKKFVTTKTSSYFSKNFKLPASCKISVTCSYSKYSTEINISDRKQTNFQFLKITGSSLIFPSVKINSFATIILKKIITSNLRIVNSRNIHFNKVDIMNLSLNCYSFSFFNCSLTKHLRIEQGFRFTPDQLIQLLEGLSFSQKENLLKCKRFRNLLKNFSRNKENIISYPENDKTKTIVNHKKFISLPFISFSYCDFVFEIAR